MPSTTFFNLDKKKQEAFLKASFQEFSAYDYHSASISEIVRVLDIAKGSVYQYFVNKLDLFFYLVELSFTEKMTFLDENPGTGRSFSAWFKNRQNTLLDFNKRKAIYSHLLNNFYLQRNNPELRAKYLELKNAELTHTQNSLSKFSSSFRKKADSKTLALLVLEVGDSAMEFPEIMEGKKISKKAKLAKSSEVVDAFADMFSKGINKSK